MKKTIIQFILKMLTLTGGLVSLLLIDSIISENIAFSSGFVLLLATAVLSATFAYWSMATPAKSKKTNVPVKQAKKATAHYYPASAKKQTASASNFHVA